MNMFDKERLDIRLQQLRGLPPFTPDKFEAVFTVTQLFETGIEISLSFVIRNGQNYYFKSTQRKVEL